LTSNSLVSSKLDCCNSLFYGLPAITLDSLQGVQNSLARVIIPSVRRHHHITTTLKELHWLPIRQRVDFKIASLTHKTLLIQQPFYLFESLIPYNPPRLPVMNTITNSPSHMYSYKCISLAHYLIELGAPRQN